jgi:hypothetical protein
MQISMKSRLEKRFRRRTAKNLNGSPITARKNMKRNNCNIASNIARPFHSLSEYAVEELMV